MLQENENRLRPPKIIQTLVEGFNLIASHPYLMLFPLALDALFWFGPFYRIKDLLSPMVDEMMQSLSTTLVNSETLPAVDVIKASWDQLLTHFNLLSTLRTYPIGIPSLLAGKGFTNNPLGAPMVFEIGSSSAAFNTVIVCVSLGLLLGGIYYALISSLVVKDQPGDPCLTIFRSISQTFVFFCLLLVVLIILSIPVLCFLSSISVFIPTMGTLPLLILGLVLMWILLPLVFTPQGIFVKQLSAVKAISLSSKFVRISSLATTFFLTIAVSLSYGLDLLWITPASDSWLLGLGIVGHAFVSSGILAATFIYFRDGTRWMEEIMKLGPQNINGTNL